MVDGRDLALVQGFIQRGELGPPYRSHTMREPKVVTALLPGSNAWFGIGATIIGLLSMILAVLFFERFRAPSR
jgi:hypothetical protein